MTNSDSADFAGGGAGHKMTLARLAALYADWRMAKVLFIGFISGFPWVLIASMLSLWLKEEGVSRTGIALFGLLFSVYAVNALWAPLVDKLPLPFLSRALGQRRAWIVLMQGVILLALLGLFFLPGAAGYPQWVALFAFVIALASATQDVAIDATRIEMFKTSEPEKVGAGSAMATSGWWLGFGGGKVIALPLVSLLQAQGVMNAWQAGYLAMGAVVLLCMAGVVFFLRRQTAGEEASSQAGEAGAGGEHSRLLKNPLRLYSEPLAAFFMRYAMKPALLLLFFIVFFKIGEAFLGRMSVIFYKEVGFSKNDIALLSGGLGTITVCLFAIFGSFFNARYGLFRGIILGGLAMALTNFLFVALAYYPEKWLFATAVVADQFTTAVSTVAFVAFISQLCDRRFTATHYAALASLGNLSRTVFAASSGALVDGLEKLTAAPGAMAAGAADAVDVIASDAWAIFFLITVLLVLPSLFALRLARPHISGILRGATTKLL